MNDQIKFLLRESGVFGIGVENAKEGIIGNAKKSFEKSGWIEIVDARLNRSYGKKFPLLNSVLFTKSNPEGEIQGQTLLGKFNTHEYRSTNKSHTNAKELYVDIQKFFTHYRSSDAIAKYEVLGTSNFEDEFKQFEKHIQNYWSLKTCENFWLSVRTNSVESFFATRLFFLPKNTVVEQNYRAKMYCCAMQWNANHFSECFKMNFRRFCC